MGKIRVAILGSCVSRDALALPEAEDFEVVHFTARTSLASLAMPGRVMESLLDRIAPKFERRMARRDMDKSFWEHLSGLDADLFMIDLIDDRYRLRRFPDGTAHTDSTHYKLAIEGSGLPEGERLRIDFRPGTALWMRGLGMLTARLAERRLLDRTVINAVYWAPTPAEDSPRRCVTENRKLADRYRRLAQVFPPSAFVTYPEGLLQSDPHHIWGEAPYHYTRPAYEFLLQELRRAHAEFPSRGLSASRREVMEPGNGTEAAMSKLATIYGGSGFVGRYIARRLAREGWRVRVAVRRPNDAHFVRPYGTPGQVEPIFCNIRDDASVRAAMVGSDAVINCVGTFAARGANNFDAVQHLGAERIARIAAEQGVGRMVHISAIGADADSASMYGRTKAKGEVAVLSHFPSAVILRPSVIFGPEDGFFNRFGSMASMGPVIPLVGGNARFQPVYVDDVAAAAVKGVTGAAQPGIFELGGPDIAPLRDLIEHMLDVIHRRRLVLNLPFWVGGLVAWGLDTASAITLGLFSNTVLTGDQVRQLRSDTVVSPEAKGLADLGIDATDMDAILPGYLWRYRPSGQYDAIKDSAKRLKKS